MTHSKFWGLAVLGMFLAVVMGSAFLPALEVHHDCSGENCPVCWCVQACRTSIKTLIPADLAKCKGLVEGEEAVCSAISREALGGRADLVALCVKLSR